MARIHCHYIDCVFIDDGYCSAAAVELAPDTGCATFKPKEESVEQDDLLEEEELDDEQIDEEEDDTWEEDKDDF